jgi:8-hydroxy-5-deazaflavin:NADPH oxidoreductase
MNIAIIGAGRLGTALGVRLAEAGHKITYASASATSARAAAERTPGGTAGTHAAAVTASDLVILSVPYYAVGAALQEVGQLDGRVLWSCVNALKPDFSGLAAGFDTSAGEQVAALARGARVVAALPPFADRLYTGQVSFDGHAPTVFCCSDDPEAKAVVAALIKQLGAVPADAGPMASSRLVEPAMMLLVTLSYATTPPKPHGLALLS